MAAQAAVGVFVSGAIPTVELQSRAGALVTTVAAKNLAMVSLAAEIRRLLAELP